MKNAIFLMQQNNAAANSPPCVGKTALLAKSPQIKSNGIDLDHVSFVFHFWL
jgi:hypothetical protein